MIEYGGKLCADGDSLGISAAAVLDPEESVPRTRALPWESPDSDVDRNLLYGSLLSLATSSQSPPSAPPSGSSLATPICPRLVFSSSGGLGLFFTSSLSLSALVSKHTALSLFCVGKPVHPTYLKAHPLLFYTFAFTLPPPFPHPNVRSTLPRSGRRCSFCCSGATTKPCRNWPRHF